MKKLILCLAVMLGGMGTASAQSDQGIGSYKANDMVRRADNLMGQRSQEGYEQAQQLLKDAEVQLNTEIEKAKADGKNEKLALLYLQNATLQNKLMTPIINNASNGLPFDTLAFCKYVDNIVNSFNQAATYNTMPNAKGKVKENAIVSLRTKLGITSMLY